MRYTTETRHDCRISSATSNRVGQSMTSLLVGLAIMGVVGAGAAEIMHSLSRQATSLSSKSGASALMDAIADEARTQTRYSDLAAKYDGKTFSFEDGEDEFEARTAVTKVCNASPSTNCDRVDIPIEIIDKRTNETVFKQTVTRIFTHHEEVRTFSSAGSFVVPQDAIGVRYTSNGGQGADGWSGTTHGYDLKYNVEVCARDYKPNNHTPPNACIPCDAPSDWKQYRSGDCTLDRCPTGKKANATQNGCEQITCPSGETLVGDYCYKGVGGEVTGLHINCHGTDGPCSTCGMFSINVPTQSLLTVNIDKIAYGTDSNHSGNQGWLLIKRNGSNYEEMWTNNFTQVVPAGTYTFYNRVCEGSGGLTRGYKWTALDNTNNLLCTPNGGTYSIYEAGPYDENGYSSNRFLSGRSYSSKSALLSVLKQYHITQVQLKCTLHYSCVNGNISQPGWGNPSTGAYFYCYQNEDGGFYGNASCAQTRVLYDDGYGYATYISNVSACG